LHKDGFLSKIFKSPQKGQKSIVLKKKNIFLKIMIVLCVQKVFGVLDPNGALISGGVRPRVDHNWVLGFFMPIYCTVLRGKMGLWDTQSQKSASGHSPETKKVHFFGENMFLGTFKSEISSQCWARGLVVFL
jgi:hypothetical protein